MRRSCHGIAGDGCTGMAKHTQLVSKRAKTDAEEARGVGAVAADAAERFENGDAFEVGKCQRQVIE
jgi:hypothetical protein